jgi:hypothetical protein
LKAISAIGYGLSVEGIEGPESPHTGVDLIQKKVVFLAFSVEKLVARNPCTYSLQSFPPAAR